MIYEDTYQLVKRGFQLSEVLEMADFERDIYIEIAARELKEQAKNKMRSN